MSHPAVWNISRVSLICLVQLIFSTQTATADDKTEPQFKTFQNIPYDTSFRIGRHFKSLDIYAPLAGKQHPIVIWVHGGAWKIGDKRGVDQKPAAFTKAGYLLVSINYRLHPRADYDQQAQDVAQAIAWVHQHAKEYGGDPQRIFLMGHSAGAHLVALVSTNPRYLKQQSLSLKTIRGSILLDGAGYDIAERIRTANETGKKIYTSVFGSDEKTWQEASPLTWVKPQQSIPPFLILHVARRDDSRRQSQLLAEKLKASRVPVSVISAPGKTHMTINREIGEPDDLPTQKIFTFLKRLSQPERPSSKK
ncbi:Carboxylesterase [Gimesia panareensis]|uniref:Carboxylesterase n=1 Tax=Gimesia panareensis TaxID=2527978 RepID=A0A518FQB1_9PLAN|nr:alpha/beta hydrolase [Gimesia panareensis]QDV18539.1 Carboxylesterase [Gimesia panareensis]